MSKYTEEQLFDMREEAYVPQPQVLDAFNKMVEQVKEHTLLEYERNKALKWNNGDTYIDEHGNERPYHHMNRRRGSRPAVKINSRKKNLEVLKVDDDGWATLTKPAKKSFGAEESLEERNKFRESLKDSGIKAKPNNKNLGSSKAVDPRDAVADKQTMTFNAFEALGDEYDDE